MGRGEPDYHSEDEADDENQDADRERASEHVQRSYNTSTTDTLAQ